MTIPFNVKQDLKDAQLIQKNRVQEQQQARRVQEEMSEEEELAHWCADPRNFGPDYDDDEYNY